MLNDINISGRLVADPEIRALDSGRKVASARIAVDRDYKNKESGERESDFFNVTAWAGTAEFLVQYFGKGDPIILNGRLQSRQYQDKDGNNRTAIEIVANNIYFAGSQKNSGDDTSSGTPRHTHSDSAPAAPSGGVDDNELPF